MHDFTGTLCAPVTGEEKYEMSDEPDAFSTERQVTAADINMAPSPSKHPSTAKKAPEETLTQLDIKNFAQRGV